MQFRHAYVAYMIAAMVAVPAMAPAAHADSAAQAGQHAGQFVDDATLTTRVKVALLNDGVTSLFKISVTSNHGVVTLRGKVDTPQTIEHAVALTTAVPGVKEVKPELTIAAN